MLCPPGRRKVLGGGRVLSLKGLPRCGKRSHTVEHSCGSSPCFLAPFRIYPGGAYKVQGGNGKVSDRTTKRYGIWTSDASKSGASRLPSPDRARFGSARCTVALAAARKAWCWPGAFRRASLNACARHSWPAAFRFRSNMLRNSRPGRGRTGRTEGPPRIALHPIKHLQRARRGSRANTDRVPPARAVLAANMETALNAIGTRGPRPPTVLPWWARV